MRRWIWIVIICLLLTTRLAALQGARNQFGIVLDGLVVSAPGTNEPITTGSARRAASLPATPARPCCWSRWAMTRCR